MSEPIATGVWCESCGFFEQDTYEEGDEKCLGCGCPVSDHTPVEIVEA